MKKFILFLSVLSVFSLSYTKKATAMGYHKLDVSQEEVISVSGVISQKMIEEMKKRKEALK